VRHRVRFALVAVKMKYKCCSPFPVWLSGNALVSINVVTLR